MKREILSQIIIFSIAVLVLFVVLSFGAKKYLIKNIPSDIISEVIIRTPNPTASQANDSVEIFNKDITALAVYRNEKYGYELKYPDTWIVYSDNAADIFIQPEPEDISDLPVPHEGALEIKVKSASSGAVLSKIANKEKEDGIDFEEEKIEIGGAEGIMINTIFCQAENCHIFEWFAIKNNYLYHLSSIYPDISYNKNFDQIISTISFFDSAE